MNAHFAWEFWQRRKIMRFERGLGPRNHGGRCRKGGKAPLRV